MSSLEDNFSSWQIVIQHQRIKNLRLDETQFVMHKLSIWTLIAAPLVPDALEDHLCLDEVAGGGGLVASVVDHERGHVWDRLGGEVFRGGDEVGVGDGRRPG